MKREKLIEYDFLRKNLIELREDNGFTQKDIANKLGISYQSYQAYELGVAVPTLQNFIKLGNIYDVSLDFLVGKKEY
ncbi:MAG: helix-turn-helix transcriptional regulator [Clostridia bacterium]|nr:helix-turn-helix transcriptional regulator [Clostridia bacterium]